MTYTPGPWNYAGPSDIGRDTYSIYGNGPLAYTAGPSDYGDAAEANARLIAAAPVTLAALKALVVSIENLNFSVFDDDGATYDQIPWAQAEAAIDKATGQEKDNS
jgi:hypothetical protein